MNPMWRLTVAADVMGIVMRMESVIHYIVSNVELDQPTTTYVNAYMATMAVYGHTTMKIVRSDEIQPLMGKRCMFY